MKQRIYKKKKMKRQNYRNGVADKYPWIGYEEGRKRWQKRVRKRTN